MVHYRPLDTTRNELRVLTLQKPRVNHSSEPLIECTLDYVSLDDYTDQYARFLELDGAKQNSRDRDIAWEIVTSSFTTPEQRNARTGTLLRSYLDERTSRFSDPSVYQDASYHHATRYRWGDFAALSYEWGDPAVTAEIVINGEKATVTRNLRDALASLSKWWFRLEMDREPTRLWIDAVCINQGDIDERNIQVKRMQDIYPLASRVLVMLGADVENGKALVSMLRLVDRLITSATVDEDFQSLEVQLAGAGSIICFGEHFCRLSTFFLTAKSAENHLVLFQRIFSNDVAGSESRRSDSELNKLFESIDNIARFMHLEASKYDGSPYANLMLLLETGRRANQYDPRDKIYGLLGAMDPELQSRIVPDYRKPTLLIYHDFAINVIKKTRKLDIIYQRAAHAAPSQSQAQSQSQQSQTPSWMPNWFMNQNPVENHDILASQLYGEASAAGDTLHTWEESSNVNHLRCRGFQVDRFTGLAYYIKLDADGDEDGQKVRNTDDANDTGQPYGSETDVRKAVWSALTLGRIAALAPETASFVYNIPFLPDRPNDDEKLPDYGLIEYFQLNNRDLLVAGRPFATRFAPWSEQDATPLMHPPFFDAFLYTLNLPVLFRRFFTTKRGYVGMAPHSTCIDDGIFILKGCKVPLVLRANGDGTYHLVGECYVEGLMNGEAMDHLEGQSFHEITLS